MNDSENGYTDWYDWLEKRVCVKGTMLGTLKYFGETNFCGGLWCGIELDHPLGKNDGMVNNVRYFTCEPHFGIFVPISKVTKLKEYSPKKAICEADFNKTFRIQENCNNVAPGTKSYFCNEWVDKAIELAKEKLSQSRQDSEESLGILQSELIERDIPLVSLTLDTTFDDLNDRNFLPESVPDSVFAVPVIDAVNENAFCSDSIKYASTPRHVTKKRFVNKDFSDNTLNFDDETCEERKFILEESCLPTPEVSFDVDKLKSNPNLTSTCKTVLDSCDILSSPKFSSNLADSKQSIYQYKNLNETQTVPSEYISSINKNEILNTTFKLSESAFPVIPCLNESEKFIANTDKLPITDTNEQINESQNFDCFEDFPKENLNQVNYNLNATFDLKYVDKEPQKLLEEETKNSTANLNMNETVNICPDINEFDAMSDITNKNKCILEKTLVLDATPIKGLCSRITRRSISVNILKDNDIEKESFNYKSAFSKETASFQNSSSVPDFSTRKSICLPYSSNCDISRSSEKVSDIYELNKTLPKLDKDKLKNKNRTLSLNNRKSISTPMPSKKEHVQENANDVFKKPFTPNFAMHKYKIASKSHSSISSKEKGNDNFSSKEGALKCAQSVCLISNIHPEVDVNSVAKKSKKIAFKDELIDSTDQGNKSNGNSKSVLKPRYSLRKSHIENFPSNIKSGALSSTTSDSPLHPKTRKENSNQVKHSGNLKSNICSKTQSADKISEVKKNIPRPSYRKSIGSGSLDINDKKSSVSNIKSTSKSLLNDVNSDVALNTKKSKLPGISQQNIPDLDHFSTRLSMISKRKSVAVCSKDALPVGIIKPIYSMRQPSASKDKMESKNELVPSVEKSLSGNNVQLLTSEVRKSLSNCSTVNSNAEKGSKLRLISSLSRKSMPANCGRREIKPPVIRERRYINTGQKIPRLAQNPKTASNS